MNIIHKYTVPLSNEGFCCHLQNLVCIKFLQMIVIFPESPQTFTWGGSQNLLFIFRSFTFCMTKSLFTWTQDIVSVKCYLENTWWFAVKGQQLHCLRQAHRHLNSFSFCTNCYREWILNTFTHFWCFLELFIGKFIPNNNEHAQDYSCPEATLRSVYMEKSYLGKAGYLVLYNG